MLFQHYQRRAAADDANAKQLLATTSREPWRIFPTRSVRVPEACAGNWFRSRQNAASALTAAYGSR